MPSVYFWRDGDLGSLGRSNDGQPEMLTVVQAARELQLGRRLMYQLTARYLAGEPDGVPAVRVGGCVRVPRAALLEFARTGTLPFHRRLAADVAAIVDKMVGPAPVEADEPPGRQSAALCAMPASSSPAVQEWSSSAASAPVAELSSPAASAPVQLSLFVES